MRCKVCGLLMVSLIALAGFSVGAYTADPSARTTGQFVHVVIFHLKSDAPAGAAEAMIADATELLAKIPSVREVRAGKPAEKGSPTAQTGYQVGLLILVDDAAGLQTYLDHPLHQEYVKRHISKVDLDKLLIYDFVNHKK